MVAPHADAEGKLSRVRNAAALNTGHTTMLVDRHASIAAPRLLPLGADDPWQRLADGERLASEIQGRYTGATLAPSPRASHRVQPDAPDAWLAHVLAFLAR